MDFEKQTPVIVQAFHYDLTDGNATPKSDVKPGLRKIDVSDDEEHSEEKGSYYDVAVFYDVIPAPGVFEVSGEIHQVVQLMGYHGDGSDVSDADWQLLSRPLVEYIETLTYEVTQVTFDQPVNLNFKANFGH